MYSCSYFLSSVDYNDIRSSFWGLWEEYQSYLYRCCIKWMDNATDAEDALSRAMLKAWDKIRDCTVTIKNFKGWARRLTYNLCVDIHRERHRNVKQVESWEAIDFEYQQELVSQQENPVIAATQQELKKFFCLAIDKLPPKLRETFILHFEEELSYKEIAEKLNISDANVRKRISQTRAILKQRYKEDFLGEENAYSTDSDAYKSLAYYQSSKKSKSQNVAQTEACISEDLIFFDKLEKVQIMEHKQPKEVVTVSPLVVMKSQSNMCQKLIYPPKLSLEKGASTLVGSTDLKQLDWNFHLNFLPFYVGLEKIIINFDTLATISHIEVEEIGKKSDINQDYLQKYWVNQIGVLCLKKQYLQDFWLGFAIAQKQLSHIVGCFNFQGGQDFRVSAQSIACVAQPYPDNSTKINRILFYRFYLFYVQVFWQVWADSGGFNNKIPDFSDKSGICPSAVIRKSLFLVVKIMNLRRLVLVSSFAVLSGFAFTSKAQAQNANVDFTGTIAPVVTIETNGSGNNPSSLDVVSDSLIRLSQILTLTANTSIVFSISNIFDNGTILSGNQTYNDLDFVGAEIQDGNNLVVQADTSPSGTSNVVSPLGTASEVQTPVGNQDYQVNLTIANLNTLLPAGTYRVRVRLNLIPQ